MALPTNPVPGPFLSTPASGPRVRFHPARDIDAVAVAWRALEGRLGSTDVMCSWDWAETWLRHYGDAVSHRFAIGEVDGKPVGVALVTASLPVAIPVPSAVESARFRGVIHLGTAGEPRGQSVDVEYNRLLCEPAWRDAFAAALMRAIRDELKPAAIQLDGFLPEDVARLAAAHEAVHPAFAVTDRPCPAFDISAVREEGKDVLAALGSGVRSRIRRSNRGFGPLQGEWAATPSAALDIYDELIALHQARWEREGRQGAFASRRFTGFHREFIGRSLGDQPRVLLYRLRNDGGTIGCLYGFLENGMFLFYQSGFVDVDDNRLKPGLSTHAHCLQACLEHGLDTYNFLAGEARYKRELATTELTLQSAIAFRYPQTAAILDAGRRLGLVERARSVKRWREGRKVARGRAAAEESEPATHP